MSQFKLLHGKHQQDEVKVDENGEALLDADGKEQMVPVSYSRGQTFDSDHDLAALFNTPGCVKFERVGESPEEAKENADRSPPRVSSVFPGGQVSTGIQFSTGGPDGQTISGPVPQSPEQRGTRIRSAVGEANAPTGKVFDPSQAKFVEASEVGKEGKKGKAKKTSASSPKAEKEDDEWSKESLDSLTVPELKEKATKHDIDLKDAHLKDDIVKAMHRGRPKKEGK